MDVAVECAFSEEGQIRVRRIRLGDRWLPVDQGRQWQDDDGRHVLVMLPGGVRELLLHSRRLRWTLRPLPSAGQII